MASATAGWTAIEVVVAPGDGGPHRGSWIPGCARPSSARQSNRCRSCRRSAARSHGDVAASHGHLHVQRVVVAHGRPDPLAVGEAFGDALLRLGSILLVVRCLLRRGASGQGAERATLPIASDPLRKFLRSSSMVAPSLLWSERLRRCWGAPSAAARWCSGASGERIRVAAWCCPEGRIRALVPPLPCGVDGFQYGAREGRVDTDRGCFSGKGMRTPPRFSVIFAFSPAHAMSTSRLTPSFSRAITPHQVGRAATIAKGGGGVANGFSDRVLGAAGSACARPRFRLPISRRWVGVLERWVRVRTRFHVHDEYGIVRHGFRCFAAGGDGAFASGKAIQVPAVIALLVGFFLSATGVMTGLPVGATAALYGLLCGFALTVLNAAWLEVFAAESDATTAYARFSAGCRAVRACVGGAAFGLVRGQRALHRGGCDVGTAAFASQAQGCLSREAPLLPERSDERFRLLQACLVPVRPRGRSGYSAHHGARVAVGAYRGDVNMWIPSWRPRCSRRLWRV